MREQLDGYRWCSMRIAAARFVVGTGKYDHITPTLRDVLYWLPVLQRIEFKIAVPSRSTVSVVLALPILQRCLRAGVGYCCSELSPFG